MRSRSNSGAMLDVYYHQLTIILDELQHPLTGLLSNRDPKAQYYHHAWMRDNVYCCLSTWGLSLAYRKCTTDRDSEARVNQLERSVVKLMRGLMMCMMMQSDKIETFKKSQHKYDCIHAKFDAATLGAACGDYEWGHLQMDAVAIYVLLLAQMTVSGLVIVQNHDEVAFIQNLVFYLENAYKTPDFGIWERGDKTNRGQVELNASSVGMAKAALEAIHDVDLFGARGSSQSTITCMPDEITQCNITLTSLLPRESNSKECDLALLPLITYPAFAVDDVKVRDQVRSLIVEKLEGNYGCKRFLRDGFKAATEDPNRLYYESYELITFENVECEWPLGLCFLLLDALYREDKDLVDKYRKKLDTLMVPCPELGFHVLPELYYVPFNNIEEERKQPRTQERLPAGKIPHFWGHSIWILTSLICDGLLSPGELDPLNRRLSNQERLDVIVQIAPVAENFDVKLALEEENIVVETAEELAESDMKLRLFHAHVFGSLLTRLGESPKMGLTGRFAHDIIGPEATSRFYVVKDTLLAFVPYFLNKQKFYLALDHQLILKQLGLMVQYFKLNWRGLGRPIVVLLITKEFLDPLTGKLSQLYLETLLKLRTGLLDGLRVNFGSVTEFYATSSIRRLGFLERIIDEERKNPLDSQPMVTHDMMDVPLLLKTGSWGEMPRMAKRMSVFRTIMTSKDILLSPPIDIVEESNRVPKVSTQTSFLTVSSNESLLSEEASSLKLSDIDSASDSDLIKLLHSSNSLNTQLDVLVFMHNKFGLDYEIRVGESCPSVKNLLKELYRRSSEVSAWSILRYSASMLQRNMDNVTSSICQILIRRKALSVGMPPEPREHTIFSPVTLDTFNDILEQSCGYSTPMAALTQEIIKFTALIMATQVELFTGMMRIRIGLIIQVLAMEIARSLNISVDNGMEYLLKLEPYCVYELVCQLFAGREIILSFTSRKVGEGQSDLSLVKYSKKDISQLKTSMHDIEEDEDFFEDWRYDDVPSYSRGTWLRRRRIDGSLTRTPPGFYQGVWKLLAKCHDGICVEDRMLYSIWTKEMTQDEMKFDLKIEEIFSRISEPEYRQILIESMMVLAKLVEKHYKDRVYPVIKLENLCKHANHLFIAEMGERYPNMSRETLLKGTRDISNFFYDSAPSGRYGTLTYLIRSTVMFLEATNSAKKGQDSPPMDCKIS
ncbi:phosphorylase b kinase regulatory subunit alpha, liver isoform-like isoform X2 [Symsagittifera roscoffensis]|uniref:phosphorylase b kinase regulatory subunit alpha, liver isoform-like isoform X2 n=1 Tax=Symsagittifera roscoffensis TaxID=84072 RepID=UPI00307B483D